MKTNLKTVVMALEHESLEYNDLVSLLLEEGLSEAEAAAVIAEAESRGLTVGEYFGDEDVPGHEWTGTYYVWGESEELTEFLG